MVNPNGSKRWRIRYRFTRREQLLSLGAYPDISLKEARNRRHEIRRQVAAVIDPSTARKAASAGEGSFEALVLEWHSQFA